MSIWGSNLPTVVESPWQAARLWGCSWRCFHNQKAETDECYSWFHSLQHTHTWRALVCHSVLSQELHVINWGFSHSSWGFQPLLKPRGSILKEMLLSLSVNCPPQAHLREHLVSNPVAFFLKVVESLGGGALLEPFSLTPFPVKSLLLEWRCNLTSQTLASIVIHAFLSCSHVFPALNGVINLDKFFLPQIAYEQIFAIRKITKVKN